jgi:hypothetical protein
MSISILNPPAKPAHAVAQAHVSKPVKVRRTTNVARALPVKDKTQRLHIGHLMTLLGVSSATVYRRIHMGDIPPPDHVFNGHPMWDRDKFMPLVDALRVLIRKRRRRGKQSHAVVQATACLSLNGGNHES